MYVEEHFNALFISLIDIEIIWTHSQVLITLNGNCFNKSYRVSKVISIIYVLNVSATFKSRKMSTWKDILISALVRGKGNDHVN